MLFKHHSEKYKIYLFISILKFNKDYSKHKILYQRASPLALLRVLLVVLRSPQRTFGHNKVVIIFMFHSNPL